MTYFYKLYQHYKDDWDAEMMMQATRTTYAAAFERAQKAEEWF